MRPSKFTKVFADHITNIECCELYKYHDSNGFYYILLQDDVMISWAKIGENDSEITELDSPVNMYGSITTLILGLLYSGKKLTITSNFFVSLLTNNKYLDHIGINVHPDGVITGENINREQIAEQNRKYELKLGYIGVYVYVIGSVKYI